MVGQDGDRVGFVCHVGLAVNHGPQESHRVAVVDMGPPIRPDGQIDNVSAVGTAVLNDDEQWKIQTFIDKHEGEHQSIQNMKRNYPEVYCVFPHFCDYTEADGRYVRKKFSCAGFVFEAYRKARIHLLHIQMMPTVDLNILKAAYPTFVSFLDRPSERIKLGLNGDGPWPVMLCSYLFHALDRKVGQIRQAPYAPTAGDHIFS